MAGSWDRGVGKLGGIDEGGRIGVGVGVGVACGMGVLSTQSRAIGD